jgi:Ca2+-binding EF-hand superfamily protein
MSLAFFACAGMVSVAHAQSRDDRFREWDRNRDGRLEYGEFTGHRGNFNAMDCDKDGYLTMNEFSQRYRCDGTTTSNPPTMGGIIGGTDEFGRLDRNDDDVLSRTEHRGSATEFRRLDRNNDGVVTRGEYFDRLDPNSVEGRFQALDRNNNGTLSRNEWTNQSINGNFDRVDRNNDGVVTLDEFGNRPAQGSREARFDVLDRNNDGVLSRVEYRGENVAFRDADRNRDNRVSFDEFMNLPAARYDERYDRFSGLDRNRDGIVTRGEWYGDRVAFELVDGNRDGVISSVEYADRSSLSNRFDGLDRNRDGWLSTSEWYGDDDMFYRLDTNRDGRVTRSEFLLL